MIFYVLIKYNFLWYLIYNNMSFQAYQCLVPVDSKLYSISDVLLKYPIIET